MQPIQSSKEPLKHHSMVRWYNPALLFRIALRSIVATVVGHIADNKELGRSDKR